MPSSNSIGIILSVLGEHSLIGFDFSGKHALVVGGSTGIGNATAQLFRAAGASVSVSGTRPAATDYAGEDGSSLEGLAYHQLDIGDRAAVAAFDPGLPRLDALVVAAAKVAYRRAEFEVDTFADVLGTNLVGPMQLAQKFRPALGAAGGSIVMVGSVASFRGTIGQPAYSASKGGLLTLTRTLAQAFAAETIRVNLVAPGLIRTKMTRVTWSDDARRSATEASIPLRRLGEPSDVAGAILFLCSPMAAYITGESILIDGGLSA